MRFSAPRSTSPSPVRWKPRSRSTFGVQSDSESDVGQSDTDSYSDSDSDTASTASTSSSDSLFNTSKSDPRTAIIARRHSSLDPAQRRNIEDTIAAIRLRTRHYDPYEEWERQTRKDAFRTARQDLSAAQNQLQHAKGQKRVQDAKHLAALHEKQVAEVQAQLSAFKMQQEAGEIRLRETYQARDRMLRERVENAIRLEEDRLKKRLEEERKVREEEEKKKREEELQRRLVEEKKRQEEETRKKEEEEARRLQDEQAKKNEEEKQRALEEERAKKERLQAEAAQRAQLGLATAEEDWREAKANLHRLKSESMKAVKGNKEMKIEWGKWRRQITPKIGQLTDDQAAISRITSQLIDIVRPSNSPHHQYIYFALLSSLAKAILLQAETEVTAEKRSAIPLAQVAFHLLDSLDGFPEIFFAKLVQRVGGWPIPFVVPQTDYDGRKWANEAERTKAMGYRKSENSDDIEGASEYTMRIAGIIRVYFHILKITPTRQPLRPMFQLPRYWIWFARLMGERGLLETAVAPQLIYTALDVLGSDAKSIWGYQWIKMLSLVYDGVTIGIGNGRFIGGESPEGKAARVRVQLEIERIMAVAQ